MSGGPTKQEASPFEQELANIATQRYEFEKRRLRPLSDLLMERAKEEKEPWRFDRAVGQGVTGALGQSSPQAQQATRGMLATPGMAPSSGAFVARQGALGLGTAAARGMGGAQGAWQQGGKYISELQKISRIGAKQAELAQQGMATAAKQLAAQNAAEAQMNAAETAQNYQMAGAAASVAVSAIGVAAIM